MTDQATMFQQKAEEISEAMSELRVLLTETALFQQLETLNAPVESEMSAQSELAAELRAKHSKLQPRVAARQRLLTVELDKAVADGQQKDAARLKKEIAESGKELKELDSAANRCENRVNALAGRIAPRSKELFTATYPCIRDSLVIVEKGVCELLDGVWADLQKYAQENNLQGDGFASRPLISEMMRCDLTARDRGPESNLFARLRYWFGGRS